MSTNFYIHELVYGKEIHIGKRSCGWEFLFRCYDNLAECDKQLQQLRLVSMLTWKKFLLDLEQIYYERIPFIIYDEYGNGITVADFFCDVIENSRYPIRNDSPPRNCTSKKPQNYYEYLAKGSNEDIEKKNIFLDEHGWTLDRTDFS